MKLPLYDELKIKNFNVENLTERFKKARVCESPYYIHIDHIEMDAKEVIKNIEEALKIIGLYPGIPYPLAIITKKAIDYHGKLELFSSKENVTNYFSNLKPKRLKGKEIGLLNKVDALAQKINNLDIYPILESFKEKIRDQRILSKNIAFLSKLEHTNDHIKNIDDELEDE